MNSNGQSLVGVLISVAIMGIILATMTSIFQFQNREGKSLSEKLGSSDLQRALIPALADGSVCRYVLNPPGSGAAPLTFNSTLVPPPATPCTTNCVTITLPSPNGLGAPASLYASIDPNPPNNPGPIIAQVGVAPSGYSESLRVSAIRLVITSGDPATNTYYGRWQVDFDGARLVRAIHSVSVNTTLTAQTTPPGSPSNAIITSCQGSTPGGGIPSGAVMAFNLATCPAGWIPADGVGINVPDLRGAFVRGMDNGRGVDPGRALNTWQGGSRLMLDWRDQATNSWGNMVADIPTQYQNFDALSSAVQPGNLVNGDGPAPAGARVTTGTVRPANVALLYCMKN